MSLHIDPFCSSNDSQHSYLLLNPPSKSHLPVLQSSIFPYLRKLDIRDDIPPNKHQQKKPLLTLKLSSTSFLDTHVYDGLSNDPLYKVKTADMCTTLVRFDPWDGSTKIAQVRWPRLVPLKGKGKENVQSITIRMNNHIKPVESFLRFGTLSGNRSFLIPGYPHTFKWRRTGDSHHCTTSSIKGPVATLDAAVSSVPPRLQIFESLLIQDTRPQLDRGGVSVNLIDHLLVTALLLVTDAGECVTQSTEGPHTSHPVISIESPLDSAPTTVKQWRKIVYGEPLFPSLRLPCVSRGPHGDLLAGEDFTNPETPANGPASTRQWRKIVYGEPLFPSLNNIQDSQMESRRSSRSSLSSESMDSPSTPTSASPVTHGFLDPSFYDSDVPPVPGLPDAYKSHSPSSSLLPSSSTHSRSPSFPASSSSIRRELPKLPGTSTSSSAPPMTSSLYTPLLHRSQSQPLAIKREYIGRPRRPLPSSAPSHRTESPVSGTPGASPRRQLPLPPVPSIHPSALVPTTPSTQIDQRSVSASSSRARCLPSPPVPRPGPSGESSRRTVAQERIVRRSIEKDAIEHNAWMQSIAPAVSSDQGRRQREGEDEHHPLTPPHNACAFDIPPPAYYAIDFSRPPHAAAPSAIDPPPPPHPDASLPHTLDSARI